MEFEWDSWVCLKFSPVKGFMRCGKKVKHSPWYIGPYCIAKRVDNVVYELDIPQKLVAAHPMFHMFISKKIMGGSLVIILS